MASVGAIARNLMDRLSVKTLKMLSRVESDPASVSSFVKVPARELRDLIIASHRGKHREFAEYLLGRSVMSRAGFDAKAPGSPPGASDQRWS